MDLDEIEARVDRPASSRSERSHNILNLFVVSARGAA